MGSRSSQPMGLPKKAREFLATNAVKLGYCEHCKRDSGYEREEAERTGMFGDDVPVFRYKLTNGSFAEEFVQEEVWSSGPMMWFGLKVPGGPDILWCEAEIAESVGFDTTLWACPACHLRRQVPALELADAGTPHCPECEEVEMEPK